jgi:hypothetical protein
MSKLTTIVATAAICLPLGAMLRTSSAQIVTNMLVRKESVPIEGHRHLTRAQTSLHEALDELQESVRTDEPLWSDKTGRATAIMEAASTAVLAIDGTADWVRNGMRNHGTGFTWARNPTMLAPDVTRYAAPRPPIQP